MFDSRENVAIFALVMILLVFCEGNLGQRGNSHRRSKSKSSYRSTTEESLKVETQNGWVRGSKINSELYGWNGIPYAKPPVGALRFQPPHKVNKLLPVMVWVHGGTFLWGNSSYTLYGPDSLVKKGVIVVSFNYRLGIFGFLSTGDKAAPGNNGLRDQLFALQWVQDNIKAFGGDPKTVTVFGESAGSASVSYLVLSQRKGLFQQAIMESGTALCLWTLSKTAKQAAVDVAENFQITTNDTQQLVSELREVDAKDLQRSANMIMIGIIVYIGINEGLVFSPVIEAESEDAVVTGSNYNNLNTGNFQHVPQIIGHNSVEAAIVEDLVQYLEAFIDISHLPPPGLVPDSMNARDDQKRQIGNLIKAEYNDFDTVGYIEYLSDNEFVRPIQETINFTSKYVTTYFYQFSYSNKPDQLGAAHADELYFLFNSEFNSFTDNSVRECMTSCWKNFAKTGNPTPPGANICGGTKWRPLTPNDRSHLYYFNINRTVPSGENPRKDKMDFWRALFSQYGNPPYVTY